MICSSGNYCVDAKDVSAVQLKGATLFLFLKSGAILSEEFSSEMRADEELESWKMDMLEEAR